MQSLPQDQPKCPPRLFAVVYLVIGMLGSLLMLGIALFLLWNVVGTPAELQDAMGKDAFVALLPITIVSYGVVAIAIAVLLLALAHLAFTVAAGLLAWKGRPAGLYMGISHIALGTLGSLEATLKGNLEGLALLGVTAGIVALGIRDLRRLKPASAGRELPVRAQIAPEKAALAILALAASVEPDCSPARLERARKAALKLLGVEASGLITASLTTPIKVWDPAQQLHLMAQNLAGHEKVALNLVKCVRWVLNDGRDASEMAAWFCRAAEVALAGAGHSSSRP
ncbi:MAG: hypothetical protein HS108_09680 [Planctomycetes bacterium]|jgi:hypothetical protein|nr:hypothetical protein [Planctomycetota bacterium]MCL4731392.1 hypothetical protein [Planctomycetota bacterium]